MMLAFILLCVVISLGSFYSISRMQEQRKAERQKEKEMKFENLMQTLNKSKAERSDTDAVSDTTKAE